MTEHRDPDCDCAERHCACGIDTETEHRDADREADNQNLPDHEGRHQRQFHPVIGARHAVLNIGGDESGKREQAEIERYDHVGIDARRHQLDQSSQSEADRAAAAKCHPARAGLIAAQQFDLAGGAVLRNKFL